MTDPKRPDETDEFEAVDDESADARANDELEADEDFDDDELDADEDSETDELETKELPRATAAARAGTASGVRPTVSRGKQASGGAVAAPADELPYVDDRVSKIWVGLIAAVFAVIFVYGLLLGRGGILTTSPSPEPSASRPPSASPGTIVSPSARPSVTIGPSGSRLPTAPASASPSGTQSPTAPPSAVPEPT